jgi:hypothetical protein
VEGAWFADRRPTPCAVKEILTHDNPAVFSPDVDARIRAAFPGIVAGDAIPPEGWKRVETVAEGEDEGGLRRRRRIQRPVAG